MTVTGSRIRTDGPSSAVTSISAADLERTGTVNVEDLIRQLPQALPGISPGINRANPGVATLNLRGLTENRTLVLIDGKRFVPYNSGGVVDVNNIPANLIERIDVVTGGASAVYGSDAMAGVVNFVMKRDFTGFEVGANLSQTGHGDGSTKNIDFVFGRNFAGGRGNFALSGGWTDRSPVRMGARRFSEFALATDTGEPGGSDADIMGTIACYPQLCYPAGGSVGGDFYLTFQDNGDLVPRQALYNYNPDNLLQIPQRRFQTNALLNFSLNDTLELYGRATLARSDVDTSIAPSAIFFVDLYDIPLASPFLSTQSRNALSDRINNTTLEEGSDGLPDPDYDANDDGVIDAGAVANVFFTRRMPEVGLRENLNRTTAWQAVTGLRGELGANWNWDLSLQHASNELMRRYQNDISVARFRESLAGCPPGSTTGCVAGNFFGVGNLQADAADFIRINMSERIDSEQQVAALGFTGMPGENIALPGARPLQLAFGAEYRREKSESFPDDCLSTPGCNEGYGLVQAVRNRYDVKELYGEARLPLLQDRPFAYKLNFDTGLRLSDYSTVGNTTAYKAGMDWAPRSDSFSMRALYQRAVRAPNIFEFGSPRQLSRETGTDPCVGGPGGVVTPELRQLCIDTGAPASAFTGNVSSVPQLGTEVNVFLGGNPEVQEEHSDTWTAGFVWAPQALAGLTGQVYWYSIDITDAISTLEATQVLDACYSTTLNPEQSADRAVCGLISRNPLTGGIADNTAYGVSQAQENIAFLKTTGIDAQIDYSLATAGLGDFRFSLLGTHVFKHTRKNSAELPELECVGLYGAACGTPISRQRFTQRTTWSFGEFDLGYSWRYLSATRFDDSATAFEAFRRISERHYVDLNMGWQPKRWAGLKLTAGVDNLLDRDPPVIGEETGPSLLNSGNTYPGAFDVLGRVFFVAAQKRF